MTRAFPLLSSATAFSLAFWSAVWPEHLLLFRLCMGSCDDYIQEEKVASFPVSSSGL